MKNRTDLDRLLEDLFEESQSPQSRSELLAPALQAARRRRRARHTARSLIGVASVVAVALVFSVWRPSEPVPQVVEQASPAFAVVSSQPLPPSMILRTGTGTVPLVESSSSTVVLLESVAGSAAIYEVSDDELLRLLKDHEVVLVRRGPNQADLFFVQEFEYSARN